MGWSGQEDGMDVMKEIIQKEIQSISSLEERVIFKNLMEGVFLSLYDTNREMYEGLERRIKEELDYDKNRYYVKTGIVEREFFDASHHLLSPMDESDLAEKLYDMKEILRAVEEEGKSCYAAIFWNSRNCWHCNLCLKASSRPKNRRRNGRWRSVCGKIGSI